MSSKNTKTSDVYLERMREHIEKIEKYLIGLDFDQFKKQELEYDAICMQLSQIGENVSKIEKASDRIVESFPNAIKWKALKGLRNRIDHDYTWLESEQIWKMLQDDIDDLKLGVNEILKKRFSK